MVPPERESRGEDPEEGHVRTAVLRGHLHLHRLLFYHLNGLNMTKPDSAGLTPLMHSCYEERSLSCFQFLLSISTSLTEGEKERIVDLLIENENLPSLRYFVTSVNFVNFTKIKYNSKIISLDSFTKLEILRQNIERRHCFFVFAKHKFSKKVYSMTLPGLILTFILFLNSTSFSILYKVIGSIILSIFLGSTLRIFVDLESLSNFIFGTSIASEILSITLLYIFLLTSPWSLYFTSFLLLFASSTILIKIVFLVFTSISIYCPIQITLKEFINIIKSHGKITKKLFLQKVCPICISHRSPTSKHCHQCRKCVNRHYFHSNRFRCCITRNNVVVYILYNFISFLVTFLTTLIAGLWLYKVGDTFVKLLRSNHFLGIYKSIWDVGYYSFILLLQIISNGFSILEISWVFFLILQFEDSEDSEDSKVLTCNSTYFKN